MQMVTSYTYFNCPNIAWHWKTHIRYVILGIFLFKNFISFSQIKKYWQNLHLTKFSSIESHLFIVIIYFYFFFIIVIIVAHSLSIYFFNFCVKRNVTAKKQGKKNWYSALIFISIYSRHVMANTYVCCLFYTFLVRLIYIKFSFFFFQISFITYASKSVGDQFSSQWLFHVMPWSSIRL